MTSENQIPEENESGITRRTLLVTAGVTGVAAATGSAAGEEKQARAFQPNRCTFAEGIEQIKKVRGGKLDENQIITSRDEGVADLMKQLQVDNIPGGFTKYQLPVFFQGGPGSQFFVSVGSPGIKVPEHSHDEGNGLRYIVGGSIRHKGKELAAGDWMFIPKGAKYSIEIGPLGATMFYCYECCCR